MAGDAGYRWGIAHLQTVWAHLCVKWKSLTANSFEDSVAELKAYARKTLREAAELAAFTGAQGAYARVA